MSKPAPPAPLNHLVGPADLAAYLAWAAPRVRKAMAARGRAVRAAHKSKTRSKAK